MESMLCFIINIFISNFIKFSENSLKIAIQNNNNFIEAKSILANEKKTFVI